MTDAPTGGWEQRAADWLNGGVLMAGGLAVAGLCAFAAVHNAPMLLQTRGWEAWGRLILSVLAGVSAFSLGLRVFGVGLKLARGP